MLKCWWNILSGGANTVLDEARIGAVADVIGDDCILYSSDLPHAHRVFDAIKLFHDRKDVEEGTKAKILANGARFFSQ